MKKYILKGLFICGLFALTVSQTGCSDLLDQKPQGQWEEGEELMGSYQRDVFSIYSEIRLWGVAGGIPPLAIHGIRSEDIDKGSTPSDGTDVYNMYDNFNYIASDGNLAGYYTGNFKLIHVANRVIADVDAAEKSGAVLTEDDIYCRAEAHFFRAFLYFNLVRAFGEVPKIDFKINDASETNIAKSSALEIYKLIDDDLTAATILPTKWANRYIGRVTWGAVKSLHAKTYLMRSDFQRAYSAANEVIGSGIYNLDTPFDKIFREEGENTSESVFELQATATAALPESTIIGAQYAQIQGVRGSGQWDLGWGWHTPSEQLANAFEEGDPRRDETLLYFYRTGASEAEIAATPVNKPYGEKPVAQAQVMNKYYNKKVYTNPAKRAEFAKFGHWMNIRMIRYSEVVLIAAESANENGAADRAVELLEMVRARARGGNLAVLPKVTTTNKIDLQAAIRHERRVELAMEWDRFYDLVRWQVDVEVLHAAGKTGYQVKHRLLPLPQEEIDKSNGVLIQNPNY